MFRGCAVVASIVLLTPILILVVGLSLLDPNSDHSILTTSRPIANADEQPAKALDNEKHSRRWPYKIVGVEKSGNQKFSAEVIVDIVDGHVPRENELAAVSNEIANANKGFQRWFISFYLPGMEVGEGVYATGHHDPELEIRFPFAGLGSFTTGFPDVYDPIFQGKSNEIEGTYPPFEAAVSAAKAKFDGLRKEAANTAVKEKLDAFMVVINGSNENGIFESVKISDNTATITVSNDWHFSHYQVRLQAAQNLWECWAKINSPAEVDTSRIQIVDGNGNRVGGSRMLGGSLIWVDK